MYFIQIVLLDMQIQINTSKLYVMHKSELN